MAERLTPLRALQVARVWSPFRPTIRAEKMILFCYLASGGQHASTAIALYSWIKKCRSQGRCGDFRGGWTVDADPCQVPSLTLKSKQTKVKVFPHLVAYVSVGRGIPHGKVFVMLTWYAEQDIDNMHLTDHRKFSFLFYWYTCFGEM
jgi:hypothetical protein